MIEASKHHQGPTVIIETAYAPEREYPLPGLPNHLRVCSFIPLRNRSIQMEVSPTYMRTCSPSCASSEAPV